MRRSLETEIQQLDRLIKAEPRWRYYEYRSLAYQRLKNYDAAATDLLAAARLAGNWYDWNEVPELFRKKTMDRILLVDDPLAILRDEMKLGPQAVEVVTKQLGIARRNRERIGPVAVEALLRRDQPASTYRIASEFLRRCVLPDHPHPNDQLYFGLMSYRLGRFQEALEILTKVEPIITSHQYVESPKGFGMRGMDDMSGMTTSFGENASEDRVYLALAIVNERLGSSRLAREWMDKAIQFRSRIMIDPGMGNASRVPDDPMLAEAEEIILDRGFPANPFVK